MWKVFKKQHEYEVRVIITISKKERMIPWHLKKKVMSLLVGHTFPIQPCPHVACPMTCHGAEDSEIPSS